ncbi:MAG: hypothetical protein Q9198_005346 [Flavoplaca austrocitrina]
MTPFILILSLLSLTAAAPISITTTTSPSSAAPTGVYTYTNTAITVSGTSIVLPSGPSTAASATSIVVPTAFVFPPFAPLDAADAKLDVEATCAEFGRVSVALPSASPSAGISAESAHVSGIPGLHSDVAAGDVHVGGSGQDGRWCVGAPHCSHSHHSSSSSASATPTSAENTHLGAPHPILPRQDEPGLVDGNYGGTPVISRWKVPASVHLPIMGSRLLGRSMDVWVLLIASMVTTLLSLLPPLPTLPPRCHRPPLHRRKMATSARLPTTGMSMSMVMVSGQRMAVSGVQMGNMLVRMG